MVTVSTKAKSNKTFFDEAPRLLGFYYPSPQQCLGKNQKKIVIRAEEQDCNDLHADSEGFAIAGSNSANSSTFNESWPSTDYHDEYGEPLNREEPAHRKFGDREFWMHNVAKNRSLQHQDKLAANSGSEEQYSTCNSINLGGNQKQVSASQRSTNREALQVQKRANKVLKSANTLLCSGNATRDNCPTNERFATEADDLKPNSTLDKSCLLNSDDVVSNWRKELKWPKEKKPSVNTIVISEGQVERNADDTSVDSSDFLVSTEGLGRSSGTNESSEEMLFPPSFVNLQDTNENKFLNHHVTDLPFSQYWKSNLNMDILYQWRIKRRIHLAREQAKSEKQGFVPRIFTQHQVTSQVGSSPKISLSVSEKQLPQDVSQQVPWYSQTETSTRTSTVPDIQISQHPKAEVSTQHQIIPEVCIPQSSPAASSSKVSVIPDCQFSLHRPSASNIQSPTSSNYQEPYYLQTHNPLASEADQLQSDHSRAIEKSSHCQKISSSQKEKVNAEVQTSLEHCQTSGLHSLSLVSPYFGQSDSHNSQVFTCLDCDILPCKHPSHNTENHTIPLASTSGSDQFPNGKTTKYHKYLVAEKPHCNNLDSNLSSSLQVKKNKPSKRQKGNLLKPDKFHGFRVTRRMGNKSLHTADTKDLYDDLCKSHTVSTYSTCHQTYLPGESSESSNELTDDPLLFLDDHSSSDEEFSSDLMLQHLRKQRSTFKEELRFIDEKLKIFFTSEKD